MVTNDNKKVKIALGGVPETLLYPLWGRAKESEKAKPYLLDPKASEIVRQMDYDFARVDKVYFEFGQMWDIILHKYLDDAIKKFTADHPKATVVNIGAGLDTAFYRVDNGSIRWYDLDLPEVINLRRKLIPETDRSKCIAKSVFDLSWLDDIGPTQDGLFLFARAVFMWLEQPDLKRLFSALATRYPDAEMIFDSYKVFVTWLSDLVNRRIGLPGPKWATSGGKQIAKWSNHIEVIDEWPLFSRVPKDTSWKRQTIMLMNLCDWFRQMKVVHLQFK